MKIYVEGFLSRGDANLKRRPEAVAVDLDEYIALVIRKEIEKVKRSNDFLSAMNDGKAKQDGKTETKTPEKRVKRG